MEKFQEGYQKENSIAWLTLTGKLTQTVTCDKALPSYLDQMKNILEEDGQDNDNKLLEATYYGLRRLRERLHRLNTLAYNNTPYRYTNIVCNYRTFDLQQAKNL